MKENKLLTTKNVVLMGMFGALAGVVMLFEFPLPFIAPPFYKIDFSEVPILVGTFTLGPIAGVIMEFVKILIKLVLRPTSTAFVGEFANFAIGCSLILPAGIIYRIKKTKNGAIAGMVAGTVVMTVMGVVINAQIMLPFFSTLYGLPMEKIVEMGAVINSAVHNVWTFAVICAGLFNLIKGIAVSFLTNLIYKKISNQIHSIGKPDRAAREKVENVKI